MSDKILKLEQAQTLYQDLRGRIDALPTSSDIPEVPVQDVQIDGTSILSQGIANIPYASTSSPGVVKVNSELGGIGVIPPSTPTVGGILTFYAATIEQIKTGSNQTKPIVAGHQHEATFYGLAKAAGDTTQSSSSNEVGVYTDNAKQKIQNMLGVPGDIQINGTSIVSNGIANIPYASTTDFGVVKVGNGLGVQANTNKVELLVASANQIKAGAQQYGYAIVPYYQHNSVFYGLTKAAGVDMSSSSNSVGNYTDEAKGAIQSMLGINSLLAPVESNTATSQAYNIGDIFSHLGKLYKVTSAISSGGVITPGSGAGDNCIETTIASNLNNKADKTDTVLLTTLSRGRKANTTVGTGSFAFGSDVEASGTMSISLGLSSVASGISSLAIGTRVEAKNTSTIAFGQNTIASAPNAHVEGLYTTASGGQSFVYGMYNVSDSYDNWAAWTANTSYQVGDKVKREISNGYQGYICKVANTDASFNIEHWDSMNRRMNYAQIIGNGTASAYSNAYVITWDGDGKYAGDVYVGCSADSTGGTRLITANDIPNEVIVSDTEPSDSGNKLWVNSSEALEYSIPTYTEFQALQSEVNSKQDAPTSGAAAGKVLGLTEISNELVPTWVNQPSVPVQDVQIDGTTILNNGVANIPVASYDTLGAVKFGSDYGISMTSSTKRLCISPATDAQIKAGTQQYKPIVSANQHTSAFYALAKAAGDSTQSASNNVVGVYTDEAKSAIQKMLGITSLLSTEEVSTATAAHTINSTFMMNGKLHRATAAIAIGDAVVVGTNCEIVKADEVFVKKTDIANSSTAGIIKVTDYTYGLAMRSDGTLRTYFANTDQVKAGTEEYRPIVPTRQHLSVFYGLSKAAGVDLANETVTLGTYPTTAQAAIRTMIGAGTPLDIQLDETSIVTNGVANIPLADDSTLGVIKAGSGLILYNGKMCVNEASDDMVKGGANAYRPVVPKRQHQAVFYGLSKVAGVDLASTTVTLGTYPETSKSAIRSMLGVPGDVQVNGTSVVANGIANIPIASYTNSGVVKTYSNYGTYMESDYIRTYAATQANIKAGTQEYQPIVPKRQHEAIYYGLSKLAGIDLASETVTVGTYPETSKTAIRSMIGVETGVSLKETISGTTPVLTCQPNVRYICGEVSTISITPPASGTCDVYFSSGSTATVLTVPSSVKFPAWFNKNSLDINTTYEIMITDGVYGMVMVWAD